MAIVVIAISALIGLCSVRWAQAYADSINSGCEANSKTLCMNLLQVKHNEFIFFRDTLWALSFALISAYLLLINADWYLLILANCLLLMALIDYQSGLLPDAFTLPLMLLAWLTSPLGLTHASSASALMIAMLYIATNIYFLLRKQYGFGGGDIKLMAVIAAWYGLEIGLHILLIACVLAILYMCAMRSKFNQIFVFGPFIAIATIVQMLI